MNNEPRKPLVSAEAHERFVFVLGEIARGRCDNGRPLAAETARQMSRHVLSTYGVQWPAGDRERGDDR